MKRSCLEVSAEKRNARKADKIRLCGHLRRYEKIIKNLYRNNFNFTPANIHAVKNSIHLTASENGEFMEKPEPDE